MNLADFIHKWTASTRTERAASQEHFIDLCRLLGESTPNEADPHGDFYAFEKGTEKVGGGEGFADVWLKDHFAWEYKGKRKSLKDAYEQLLQYHEELDNPPLLVVCDLDRFEVHTNFTGTAKRVYAFALADLPNPEPTPTCPLPSLDVLRRLFKNPGSLWTPGIPIVDRVRWTFSRGKVVGTTAVPVRMRLSATLTVPRNKHAGTGTISIA